VPGQNDESRGGEASQRSVRGCHAEERSHAERSADPLYNSTLVTKFINTMMSGGKRAVAQASCTRP